MRDAEAISKDSLNQSQGFKYRSIDAVYNMLNPILAKHGVFTVPNVLTIKREERQTKNGGNLIYTVLEVAVGFFAEDGSCVSAKVIGEGMDSGDKSSNKAMAVAHKYAYLQVFSIPTEDEKDPDAHSWDVKSNAPVRDDQNPEDYVVPFSKKYKGMSLLDIGIDQAIDFKNWLIDSSAKSNKPLGTDAVNFINAVDEWDAKLRHELDKKYQHDVP